MKSLLTLLFLLVISTGLMAQVTSTDSLFNSMSSDKQRGPVTIFESPRLILTQSTEMLKKKNMNLVFVHRFGDVAGDLGGGRTLFGLDAIADVYIGFEYGLTY